MNNVRLHERLIEMAALKGFDPSHVRQSFPARPDAWTADMLLAQLEGPWTSWDALPVPRRRFLNQVGLTALGRAFEATCGLSSPDSPGIGVETLLERCIEKHAFVASVSIAMIHLAKTAGGVVPSTDFMWTRTEDPHAWRMINGYGRPAHIHEVVGAFAQWEAEKTVGRPIPAPDFRDLAEDMSYEAS